MDRPTYTGTCHLCKRQFSRASMTRHLAACSVPGHIALPSGEAGRRVPGESLLVFVESRYMKAYWMHLAAPLDAPLSKLDRFLRDIWLECCDHLSAFNIGDSHYLSMTESGESGMESRLRRLLTPGMAFSYKYDFGSTTELSLKVVGRWERGTSRGAIEVLARNEPPRMKCDECGKEPAVRMCTECVQDGTGWLCSACVPNHKCEDDFLVPVPNSPRAGVCAYTG